MVEPSEVFGVFDYNLKLIEKACNVQIAYRGDEIAIMGDAPETAEFVINELFKVAESGQKLDEQKQETEEKYHVTVHTIAVDLSQPDAAQMIYDTCKQNGWEVDYLINNAGFGGQGDLARERTMDQDMSMIAVNI